MHVFTCFCQFLTLCVVLVNPGAKERLVQITGSNEESINYAKLLIEDTIKRNASPIREASQEGSCSSLASSDDQQITAVPRARQVAPMIQQSSVQGPMGSKLTRSTSQHNTSYLVHSQSQNDAAFGEYKYTVNVGSHNLKITGDSLELVRVCVVSKVFKHIYLKQNLYFRLQNLYSTTTSQTTNFLSPPRR